MTNAFLPGSIATSRSYSSRENCTIFMNCNGMEESVFDCEFDSLYQRNHTEGASVICAALGQLLAENVIEITDKHIRGPHLYCKIHACIIWLDGSVELTNSLLVYIAITGTAGIVNCIYNSRNDSEGHLKLVAVCP